MDKRIGILTFHNTTNYGAALQAYALQKKINELGYYCDTIKYKNENIDKIYRPQKLSDIKNIKELAKFILLNNGKKKLYERFQKFYNENMNFSFEVDKSNITKLNRIYDKFIVGSDQVWNLDLSYQDYNYYLQFVENNNKKNAYAASFGYLDIPEKYRVNSICELKKFKNIGVREIQGRHIINKYLNRDVSVVLDPTLLLKKSDWLNLIKSKKNNFEKDKFVLLYIVSPNDEIIEFSKKIAEKYKAKIIWINNSTKKIKGIYNMKNSDPIDFLYYIYNSKCVITTSFHGVALSIALNKDFYFGLSNEKNNFNSRIESLTEILELKNRNLNKEEFCAIDYKKVNMLLEKEQKNSLNYLKKILEEKI